jgi:hypothetical protein
MLLACECADLIGRIDTRATEARPCVGGLPTASRHALPKTRGVGRATEVGADMSVGIRLPARLLYEVDAWSEASRLSRSEAIRKMIEVGLKTLRQSGGQARKQSQGQDE